MYYLYTHEELDVADRASLNGFARSAKIHGRSKMKVNELRDALRERLPPREGTSPGLFVELCAGTAAVSLQLHREGARPPVSRMGSKRGYAVAVLHALGLYPGLQADHYLWCEPDDGCRLLLETYRDHDLALKVAEIIRGWKDEDPRSLWERLRKEGPVKAPTPREAARSLVVGGWSFRAGNPDSGYNKSEAEGHPDSCKHPRSCTIISEETTSLPVLPAEVTDEAVDPREVARWLTVQGWSHTGTPMLDLAKCGLGNIDSKGRRWGVSDQAWIAGRISTLPTLPGEITDGAVEPPLLPPNTVVYIDPPYVNTTGYKHNLPRERVVELALAWYAAGAKVAISEQEAIPELIAQGWTAVDITDKRLGQKRTFSIQKKEYLTLSPGTKC
jgi:hypothetical protein